MHIAKSGSAAGRWFQLGLVLLISIGPIEWNSIYFYLRGHSIVGLPGNTASYGAQILFECACLLLLSIFLWRRNVKWRDLGLCWSARDILLAGPLLALGAYCVYWLAYNALAAMHNAFWPSLPFTVEPSIWFGRITPLIIVFNLLNPLFEELIVRAFLMTEVRQLTGSSTLAVILSTAIQTSYHIYYGGPVMFALFFEFQVFSIYYARTRRATPLVVAHACFDLYIPLEDLIASLFFRFLH